LAEGELGAESSDGHHRVDAETRTETELAVDWQIRGAATRGTAAASEWAQKGHLAESGSELRRAFALENEALLAVDVLDRARASDLMGKEESHERTPHSEQQRPQLAFEVPEALGAIGIRELDGSLDGALDLGARRADTALHSGLLANRPPT
jgi:hypothetical protein